MKIKIKFDNPGIKCDSKGKKGTHGSNDNPRKCGFIEFDLDIFKAIYQMFPPNIISYYNAINKAKGKPVGTDKESNGSIPDEPGILPVNGHDIFNYVARFGSANFQIQAVIRLNGRLDHDKLQKAVRLSIDTEPVFGCRLAEKNPPYWKRLTNIDNTAFCTFERSYNPGEAVRRFLESPLDMDYDPMVKLNLINSGPYDTLCVKINHACCDATGTKEFLQLLSDNYTLIDKGEYVFPPRPRMRSRRDQDRLFNTLGIKDPDAAWSGELDNPKTMWPFPWRQGKPGIASASICKLPLGYVNVMSKYAQARGATINDLILTAFYRAMFEMSKIQQGVPMDISMTVDLRRYLPGQKTEAIRNFSGGIDTKLPMVDHETFEGTLARVIPMMNEIKKKKPGLQSAVGLERVERAIFSETLSYYQAAAQTANYSDKCSPVLSNLGFINRSVLRFGKAVVTDAYIVPPAVSAPGILLCVGTYNGITTLSVSYYKDQVRDGDMNTLLNLIKQELLHCCRP